MEISPKTLEFKSDFKTPTTTTLTVKNTENVPMAFKVKTNAARVYSVKPNINVVQPNESVKVTITLPILRQSLPANYKSKHKFLIVSLPADGLDTAQVQKSWPELQAKYKDSLNLSRVKVSYVNLNEPSATPAAAKLNGKSKRISKFVPNGSTAANELNGTSAGIAAAALAGAAATGAAATGAGAIAMSHSEKDDSNTRSYDSNALSRPSVSHAASNGHHYASNYNDYESRSEPYTLSIGTGTVASKDVEEIRGQVERMSKKLDNIEKLLILALMLLSFILGKSMV